MGVVVSSGGGDREEGPRKGNDGDDAKDGDEVPNVAERLLLRRETEK
jgi:hypothetical protein